MSKEFKVFAYVEIDGEEVELPSVNSFDDVEDARSEYAEILNDGIEDPQLGHVPFNDLLGVRIGRRVVQIKTDRPNSYSVEAPADLTVDEFFADDTQE